MCLAAAQNVIDNQRYAELEIPAEAVPLIEWSWNAEPPALYGRFDILWGGSGSGAPPKLLEYNADTPTSLLEAAVIQWYWLQDTHKLADQFNSLHEKLVAKWKDLLPYVTQPVWFTHDGAEEDGMTIAYLQDTAHQAGLKTSALAMRQIGWDSATNSFVDRNRHQLRTIFKLYPWEWMLTDSFGDHALATMNAASQTPLPGKVQWLEPIWKMMWSNKALLAILWELYPNHELLLPAYLDGPHSMQNYIRKPLVGREGAGAQLFRNWAEEGVAAQPNPWDQKAAAGQYVYQAMANLAQADGKTAVLGSWLIDGEPAGMGIRESDGPITDNTSRFVPHLFR